MPSFLCRLGAGHGGYGGASKIESRGGDAYGSLYTPRHLGSGGGNGNVGFAVIYMEIF